MAALSFYAPDGDAAKTNPLGPGPLLWPGPLNQHGPLFQRGHATTYYKSKKELDFIGMPVGGIHSGTLYLGGDGRLWLWDIFNLNQEGVNPLDIDWDREVQGEKRKIRSRDGSAYVAPARAEDLMPVDQGFLVRLRYGGKEIVRTLQKEDWDEVSFEATYPVATIKYTDHELPIEIEMKAYSPFIPLDEENSGLPATVFSILIRNKGRDVVHAEVAGWLENKTAMYSARPGSQLRRNSSFRGDRCSGVHMTIEDMSYPKMKIADKFDFGSMCLASLDKDATCNANASASILQRLTGRVSSQGMLPASGEQRFHFVISWHTPNLVIGDGKVLPQEDRGRWYANRFGNAQDVAQYVADHFKDLESNTLLWRDVWYDSSLPYWFLERTFLNISTLATTTSHRFRSGRHWAWEGVGACEGNCTHVWQYAQATGRIFPSMERDNRERVDLGISLQEDGGIWFRGEYDKRPAIDGQAGRILGFYREHQMSKDDDFLKRNWEKIKRAVQFVIAKDRNGDGMEDTPLENTLDAVWDGEIAWIVGLCIVAVQAGRVMAEEMNDTNFAAACQAYVQKGKANMEQQLFNGEYFIHKPDAIKGRANVGSYNTCHIDQVFGQSWAFQTGLGRILDKEKTISALRALWKYNFMTDVGPYIKTHTGWRPYALPGEGGMVMNTNPAHEEKPYGDGVTWQMGYFHECMSGFEHQVASHMMAEGMVEEAMTLTRAIHDRYHASKRNPFNEIECSDHYGRALASYGTFITACGFEYHGPRGHIRMAPKIGAEDFKAPFTSAEGWGTYTQRHDDKGFKASFRVRYGRMEIRSMSFEIAHKATVVRVKLDGQTINVNFEQRLGELAILLDKRRAIENSQTLQVQVS